METLPTVEPVICSTSLGLALYESVFHDGGFQTPLAWPLIFLFTYPRHSILSGTQKNFLNNNTTPVLRILSGHEGSYIVMNLYGFEMRDRRTTGQVNGIAAVTLGGVERMIGFGEQLLQRYITAEGFHYTEACRYIDGPGQRVESAALDIPADLL